MGSTGACCAKLILGILNTLFLLVGLALIAAGALVIAGADFIASVLKAFKDLPVISDYITIAAWVLVGIGIFLVVMGILGGCGACCSIKVFLIIYVIIMILLLLIEVTFVALLFSDKLKELLSDPLTKEFKKYQPIISGSNINADVESRAMDLLFISLKCCGWNGYSDMAPKNAIGCCKGFTEEILQKKDLSELNTIQTSCANPTGKYSKGCYNAILDLIEDNKPMVIGVGVALFVFQILCILFAIWIVKDSAKITPGD
ncbi:CD82 antigen-like [Saccostrea echinata]|uniref:CD82 antigen-like n=1 Tax=Saccostrea echinata TaxID=191078 RepID=UPI002A825EA8|nr:CD82 antigen-like [Saccostrea echinata]